MRTRLTKKGRTEYRTDEGGMAYNHLRLRLEIIFDMLKYIMSASASKPIVNFFAKAWEAIEPQELYKTDWLEPSEEPPDEMFEGRSTYTGKETTMEESSCCSFKITLSELLDAYRAKIQASIKTAKDHGATRIAIEVTPDVTTFEGARIFCASNIEQSTKEHLLEIGYPSSKDWTHAPRVK